MAKIARVSALALTIGFLSLLGHLSAQSPNQQAVYDYDSMRPLSQAEHMKIWPQLSPETVADINRTKLIRWTVVNRDKLTSEQAEFMYAFAASISADMYRHDRPATPETEARREAFEERSRQLFPDRGPWIEAFSFEGGGYIPPVSLKSN
jgi:hypothetical protein